MKTRLWNSPAANMAGRRRIRRESFKPLTAGDIMAVSVRSIEQNSSVNAAYDEMRRFNLRSLMVSDKSGFVGVITQENLDRAMQLNLGNSEISLYLPAKALTVTVDTSIYAVKRVMLDNFLSVLAVIDKKGRAAGLITQEALLRALPDTLTGRSARTVNIDAKTPGPSDLERLFKRIFPISVYYLLCRIGRFAADKDIQAYAVGGFVRDLLLERQNLDIDIVVIGDAIPFVKELGNELACEYKVFEAFHTGRIYLSGFNVDFSSARIEHYSEIGALPEVELSGLYDDLRRRDFTINALALSLHPEHLFELQNNSGWYADIVRKQIRILHPYSFYEDPTRLFRAVRFAVRFGFLMNEDTLKSFRLAVKQRVPEKLTISRIGAEISKCFNEQHPYKVIEVLFETGLMRFFSAELADSSGLPEKFKYIKTLVRRFAPLNEPIDTDALFWAGLIIMIKPSNRLPLLNQLGIPHKTRRLASLALDTLQQLPEKLEVINENDSHGLYALMHELPLEALIALLAFSYSKNNVRKVLIFITKLRKIKCEINGHDLIKAGIKPGALIGKIFSYLIGLKLDGVSLTREQELDIAIQQFKYL